MSRERTLPTDIERLQDLVSTLRAVILERDVLIGKMRFELTRLKRMQFGRSSEQLDQEIAQLELSLEELEASETETEERFQTASAPRPERQKPVRRPLPATLPRETITHAAACTCPACGGELRAIGEDVAEVLEYVPSRFKVIRMCDLNSRALPARAWCKARRPVAPLPVAWLAPDYWPTCSSVNTPITCRCIGSRRFMHVKGSI